MSTRVRSQPCCLRNWGARVTLDGDLAVTFYPWLGLEVGGVSVGNAEGFGPEPFLSADHVRLRARTLPLLRNNYELDVVRVKGVVINLARRPGQEQLG